MSTTVIHVPFYRFKISKKFSGILCSFCFIQYLFPHLLKFQKLNILSLVPCNFYIYPSTPAFLHPLCLGFHFRKVSSKTAVKLEHSPRYKLMVNRPHSLPLHLNLPQKKTKPQMLTKWVLLLVHSIGQCCNVIINHIIRAAAWRASARLFILCRIFFVNFPCVFQLKPVAGTQAQLRELNILL